MTNEKFPYGKNIKLSSVSDSCVIRYHVATPRDESMHKVLKRSEKGCFKPAHHSLGYFGKLPLELLIFITKNLDTMDQVRFIFCTHKSLRRLEAVPTIWENVSIHEQPRRNICRDFSYKIIPNLPRGCVRNLSIHCIGGKNHTYQPLNLLRELRLHGQTLYSLLLSGSQKSVHESLLAITFDDITDLGKLLGKLKILIAHPGAHASKNIRPDQLITLLQLLPNLETLILENFKCVPKPLCGIELYNGMAAMNLKTLVVESISITLPIMNKLGSFFPVLEKLHMGTISDANNDRTEAIYHPLPRLRDFSATYSGARGNDISSFFVNLIEGSPNIQELSFCCLRPGPWNILCAAKLYRRPIRSPNLKQIRLGGWGIPEEDIDGDWFYEDIWQRPDIAPKWQCCCCCCS